MKIEIDYNGAYAVCRVNGKYLYQCDSLTIAQTFSAFRTIEQHFRREGKFLLFTGLEDCDDTRKITNEVVFHVNFDSTDT